MTKVASTLKTKHCRCPTSHLNYCHRNCIETCKDDKSSLYPKNQTLQVPGSKYHAIYAASFAPAKTSYPLVWNESWVQPGIDVTQVYIDAE